MPGQRTGWAAGVAPHAAMLGIILIWGGNAVSVKVGIAHVSPVVFTAIRFFTGGVLLMGVAAATQRQLRRPPIVLLIVAALSGVVVQQLCFAYGLALSTAVDISLIVGLGPIFTVLLVMIVRSRLLPPRQLIGLGLGFAGLVLVVAGQGRGGGASLRGDLIALGAPAAWAVYMLISASALRTYSASVFIAWTMLVAGLMMVPLSAFQLAVEKQDWSPALGPLLYSSVLATAVCYLAYFWAMGRLGVTGTVIYTYFQPAFGAAAGALLLHERLSAVQAAGAAAIMVAAYLGRSRSERRRTPADDHSISTAESNVARSTKPPQPGR